MSQDNSYDQSTNANSRQHSRGRAAGDLHATGYAGTFIARNASQHAWRGQERIHGALVGKIEGDDGGEQQWRGSEHTARVVVSATTRPMLVRDATLVAVPACTRVGHVTWSRRGLNRCCYRQPALTLVVVRQALSTLHLLSQLAELQTHKADLLRVKPG